MVDMVVPRGEMRSTLARLCGLLMHAPRQADLPVIEEPVVLAAVAE